MSSECVAIAFNNFFFLLTALFITKVYNGIQTYRRSVSLSPLTIIFFLLTTLFITKVYSGIQTYRRSVSLSPLTIFFFLLTALFITKVYSGIQTYRRSVSLSPLTIFFFLLTALFITKVYSGIQTYRRSVSLSPLTIIFFLLTAQLSLRLTVQWHPDVSSECATVAVPLKIIFSFFSSSFNLYFEHADYLMSILTTAPRCAVGVCQCY